jgi:hypothetical protein
MRTHCSPSACSLAAHFSAQTRLSKARTARTTSNGRPAPAAVAMMASDKRSFSGGRRQRRRGNEDAPPFESQNHILK